ncbi:hypothetical protein ACFYW9_19345 [Streptomyces sp. NPDC002698]|uniref:hypothetical protein n=1 Tax=Streptomyces sp. NPDC002698 TaxID=3364660 RepID=UPI0036905F4A
MSACRGACFDCPYDFCAPETRAPRQSDAQRRTGWRQDALSEMDDLADLYGVDPQAVRLR